MPVSHASTHRPDTAARFSLELDTIHVDGASMHRPAIEVCFSLGLDVIFVHVMPA